MKFSGTEVSILAAVAEGGKVPWQRQTPLAALEKWESCAAPGILTNSATEPKGLMPSPALFVRVHVGAFFLGDGRFHLVGLELDLHSQIAGP